MELKHKKNNKKRLEKCLAVLQTLDIVEVAHMLAFVGDFLVPIIDCYRN